MISRAKESGCFGLGVGGALFLELPQEFPLAFGQLLRRFDHNLDIHVPAALRAQHRHALVRQAETLSGLGAFGNLHSRAAALQRRHLELAAERRRHHADRHAAIKIRTLALEHGMRLEGQENIEIAGRAAAHAGLALTGEANARAILNASGNVHFERSLAREAAGAAASGTRRFDYRAATLAGGTGTLDGKETLCMTNAAGARACAALDRFGTRLRAGAGAGLAGHVGRKADLCGLAAIRFVERNFQIIAQIGAALAARAAAAAAHAEQIVEDVGKGRSEIAAEAVRMRIAGGAIESGVPKAIIGCAFLFVLKDVVGFVDLLELLLAALIAGIAVRVPLHGELAVGGLDLFVAAAARNAQDFVVIALRHGFRFALRRSPALGCAFCDRKGEAFCPHHCRSPPRPLRRISSCRRRLP